MRRVVTALIILLLSANECYASCVGLGCTCSVVATGINFGSYSPFSGSPNKANGNLQVTCTAIVLGGLVSYTVAINAGNSGNFSNRYMLSGAHQLPYNIYNASNYTTILGDGTGGTAVSSFNSLLTISPTVTNYTMYGQITAGHNVYAGSYSDTITVTLTF